MPFQSPIRIIVIEFFFFFLTEFHFCTNNNTQHLVYLRVLALETINNLPWDMLQMDADGSRGDGTILGSRVFIKREHDIRICKKKS